ncbi:glutathione S-transferase [Sphingomonas sp. BHC-A]|nr:MULTISPECIES: glutathione S-transferase family protein [Sphingobium]KER36007.1 glutathione S-transferase [Sphingobium indicum F2]KEY99556.1 glutathione S-transferase [Sphingomonas sp. BHC-A]NYI24115.1 glutathione S-transferase [Sphingobium indicum]
MKLFWSSRSPFARKVVMVAHETGLHDRVALIPLPIPSPVPCVELHRANPIAKLPTLIADDGTAIADSPVICEYLDHLGGGSLFPVPGPARWRALGRQALADGLMDQLLLWRAELRRAEACRSATLLATFAGRLDASLDRLEEQAAGGACGAGFDIGDLTVGVMLAYLDFRFAERGWRDGRPALAKFQDSFAARPSAIATAFAEN